MAQGNSVIRGTFYADVTDSYTINFGKTLNRYFVYFEMDKESKEKLALNANGSNKSYGFIKIKWDECDEFTEILISYTARTNGPGNRSTGSGSSGGEFLTMNSDNITFNANSLSNGSNYIYYGYTYNYIIVPLD